MPLVSIDSNVIDLMIDCTPTREHVDAMECQERPPPYRDEDVKRRIELEACYWLLSLGCYWQSCLYTFSDELYREIADAPTANVLSGLAIAIREFHDPRYRTVDLNVVPLIHDVTELGIKPADAVHIADAIGLSCDYFLTNDRRLLGRSQDVAQRWDCVAVARPRS